jgi:C4-dicarboxylate transporter DctM subunit
MELTVPFLFLALILLGVPIAYCICATGLFAVAMFTQIPLSLPAGNLYHALDSYTLIAVPLFFVAGNIMASGSLAPTLVEFARACTAYLRGGLGVAAVLACGIFASITGSSTTALIAIGAVMYGSMIRAGYSERFSAGLLMSAGSLGILIPPSVPMIVFAHIANVSVGKMFLAGVVPGLLVLLLLAIYAYFFSDSEQDARQEFSWRRLTQAARRGVWALSLPALVLGGIYGGLFTVTEAAGVSVIYALFVEKVVYRSLRWRDLPRLIDEAALFSAAIMLIIAMAAFFSQYLTLEQIPPKLAQTVTEHVHTKFMVLLTINLFLLLLGTFMEIVSAMLIVTPVLIAIATRYQIDLIHLGIIFVINMEIGFMTPPLGLNLFAAQGLTKLKIGTLVRGALPTMAILSIVLMLVTYVPEVALWLPNRLMP